MTRWRTICSDPKVVQKLHTNPITKNTTGYGYKECEETNTKSIWNETLQKNPINTTESLHGFHHIEQLMKL
jgi:hypothetical protein